MRSTTAKLLTGYTASGAILILAVMCHFFAERVQRKIQSCHDRMRSKHPRPNWAIKVTGRNYVPQFHGLGVVLLFLSLVGIAVTTILSEH